MSRTTYLGLAMLLWATGCVAPAVDCVITPPEPGKQAHCSLAAWPDRSFFMTVPAASETAHPVLVVFHGGGSNKRGALKTTCPSGNSKAPECLGERALARNMVVVAPDGTKSSVINNRTWNAGGGVGKYRCTTADACERNIDDMKYFDDLMAEVGRIANVDNSRTYLAGLSNGGAISYRLACERSDRVAAIAPVSGANQAAVAPGCTPSRPVPVLHFHGTADPAWRYEGGAPLTGIIGQPGKEHVGVEESVIGGGDFPGWVEMAGCSGEPKVTALEDTTDDGTTSERFEWNDCAGDARVHLVKITGGGHTWPQGDAYLKEKIVGPVAQDFSANAMMLDFFGAHTSSTVN